MHAEWMYAQASGFGVLPERKASPFRCKVQLETGKRGNAPLKIIIQVQNCCKDSLAGLSCLSWALGHRAAEACIKMTFEGAALLVGDQLWIFAEAFFQAEQACHFLCDLFNRRNRSVRDFVALRYTSFINRWAI